LELIPEKGQGIGSYSAIWDTAGIEPTRRGGRQDILFVLEVLLDIQNSKN